MLHVLSWFWHVAAWCLQVLWLNLYYVLGFAGFARIAWMAFNEGRRYQVRRIREMLARVRASRQPQEPPATVSHVERDAA